MNYTEEMTKEMIDIYTETPTLETVDLLAEKFNKPRKSIIGKLSKEGVYKKLIYVTKRGEKPETKLEIVAQIAAGLELDPDNLEGLEKAPKPVLQTLCLAVNPPD